VDKSTCQTLELGIGAEEAAGAKTERLSRSWLAPLRMRNFSSQSKNGSSPSFKLDWGAGEDV
jgi:hypothetical protein